MPWKREREVENDCSQRPLKDDDEGLEEDVTEDVSVHELEALDGNQALHHENRRLGVETLLHVGLEAEGFERNNWFPFQTFRCI